MTKPVTDDELHIVCGNCGFEWGIHRAIDDACPLPLEQLEHGYSTPRERREYSATSRFSVEENNDQATR